LLAELLKHGYVDFVNSAIQRPKSSPRRNNMLLMTYKTIFNRQFVGILISYHTKFKIPKRSKYYTLLPVIFQISMSNG
jgi:hypothetical protein